MLGTQTEDKTGATPVITFFMRAFHEMETPGIIPEQKNEQHTHMHTHLLPHLLGESAPIHGSSFSFSVSSDFAIHVISQTRVGTRVTK